LLVSSIACDQEKLMNSIIHMMQTRNIEYLFHPYDIDNRGIEILPNQAVKFTGCYELKEITDNGKWSNKGFSNYFIFEKKDDDNWLIVDTNFHTKLDWDYSYLFIFLLFFPFNIWMLIDCFNRKFEKRGKWFCIIIFIPFIGSLIYFFCIKLKQWENQPDYYEKYLQNNVYSKESALTIRNNWIYSWTLSLLAMIACIGIPHAICNNMMLDLISAIKVLLSTLPFMYIFSFIFAYLNLGTGAISLSLWGLLVMILFRGWECIINILSAEFSFQSLLVFLIIILWLSWLFIVSYRLLRLHEAVQDKKNTQV
jgi:hypothetical protein